MMLERVVEEERRRTEGGKIFDRGKTLQFKLLLFQL